MSHFKGNVTELWTFASSLWSWQIANCVGSVCVLLDMYCMSCCFTLYRGSMRVLSFVTLWSLPARWSPLRFADLGSLGPIHVWSGWHRQWTPVEWPFRALHTSGRPWKAHQNLALPASSFRIPVESRWLFHSGPSENQFLYPGPPYTWSTTVSCCTLMDIKMMIEEVPSLLWFCDSGSLGHTPGESWTIGEFSWHIESPARMEEQGEGFERAEETGEDSGAQAEEVEEGRKWKVEKYSAVATRDFNLQSSALLYQLLFDPRQPMSGNSVLLSLWQGKVTCGYYFFFSN